MTENMMRFLEEAGSDAEFLERVNNAETAEDLFALAKEKGLDLCEEDLVVEIPEGELSDDDIDGVVGGSAMAGSMTAGSMTAGSMTAGSMMARSMTAGSMTAGSMTAGSMTAGSMTAGSMTAGSMLPGNMINWGTLGPVVKLFKVKTGSQVR